MLVIITLFALIILSCFLLAGRFLVVNQTPVKSDAIIIAGGGDGEREVFASLLYKQGYAAYIIVSNGGRRGLPSTDYAKIEIARLIEYKVPEEAIIPELEAQSTYGNAVFTERVMKKYNFRSAIVLSSTYHMRRSQYIFNKVYKHSGIQLTYCAADVGGYSPDFWWKNRAGWTFTISEYKSLFAYFILYGLLNNKDLYS